MNEITKALMKAFVSLLHPRMLLLMLWPVVIALVLWLGLAFAFWLSWLLTKKWPSHPTGIFLFGSSAIFI